MTTKQLTANIIAKDKRRKELEAKAASYKEKATVLKDEIIKVMREQIRSNVVESDGWAVRWTAAQYVEYDDPAIIAALTPTQRRKVTRELVDLNALPAATRKRILAQLEPRQKRAVTTVMLDHEALSREVQAGNIDADIVARHSDVKERAPYISSSGPSKGSR